VGLVAERKKELDQAAEIFRSLLLRYPDHGPSYEELGSILLKQRKYKEAERALEEAVRLDPKSAKAHYQLGVLLARAGKGDESSKQREIAEQIEAEGRGKSQTDLRILMPQ
jgi:tetratricopeptide (TPR) repeat protein